MARTDVALGAPRWARLASAGFFCAVAAVAMLLVAIVAFRLESEGESTFLLVAGAVALAGALLVRRFGWWSKALAIVGGLMLSMMLFWTAFSLRAFASFFDFMPGLLVLPGALLGIGASIAALVAGRRGHRTPATTGNERRAIRTIGAVVAAAAVISGALTVVGRSNATSLGATAAVKMKSFKFDRKTYRVRGGTNIFVRNDDPFLHTFTIDALDVDETTSAGDKLLVKIPRRLGRYVLYCKLHVSDAEHPKGDDMAARLVVD